MTPENAVKKAVLDLLNAEGIFAFRLNTVAYSAEYKGKKRFFQSHGLGKGAADIQALVPTQFTDYSERLFRVLWVEVKSATGKQSAEQQGFQEFVESRGQSYIVAYSSDDVLKWLRIHKEYGGQHVENRKSI